jgi:CheY-like chemotaxis protein/nitrogen-specific signal transduction histidine kinase
LIHAGDEETDMARRRSKKQPLKSAARGRRQPRTRFASAPAIETSLVAYAHDIRTALTGILALSELLTSSNLGDRERRWAWSIKNSAEHLASLTTLIVDAAKAESAALTLRGDVFQPRRIVEALAESLSARAEAKNLKFDVTVADAVPDALVGDPVRLRAALENLIDNAVKFTERGTVRVTLGVARAARGRVKLVFAVADSGIGLKATEVKRLFRPFTQASADIARRYGGSGLGLAIVKSLARRMGGDLTVTSAPGRGSTFRFSASFPIAPATDGSSGSKRRTTVAVHRLRILCVEDNPYGRVILNTILTELGHRADFAGSGEEAIAAAARGYDAILMDVTLPGITGLEATRRIRALAGAVGRKPIIGLSGRTQAGDEDAARAAGMDAYLRKPLSPSALSDALAAVAVKSTAQTT